MTITAGVASQVSVTSTTAVLVTAPATGGTAPYTYQWYRSTTTAFTPGAGNIIAGATALTLSDSGLIPNTAYFYKNVAIDNVAATVTTAQLAVATAAPSPTYNQFAQTMLVPGQLDLRLNFNTVSMMVDASQVLPLYSGAALKVVSSLDGVPKVVGCAANSDACIGFLTYDNKTVSFTPGQACEVSLKGNVMYLYATTVIPRFSKVQLDLSSNGGVAALVGASGASYVGWAYDNAATVGQLIRVYIEAPSFTVA